MAAALTRARPSRADVEQIVISVENLTKSFQHNGSTVRASSTRAVMTRCLSMALHRGGGLRSRRATLR